MAITTRTGVYIIIIITVYSNETFNKGPPQDENLSTVDKLGGGGGHII